VTALTPLILAFGSREVNANPSHSSEKINSPEYAEEVRTDQSGYKHWRFGDVWYSNAPLDEYSVPEYIYDSIPYDSIRMDPFFQPNDSNLVWYGSGDVDSNNIKDWEDYELISQGIQNDQADIDGDGIPGTQKDAELFAKYLNGDTLLPQVSWNWEICSKENRKSWLEKMLTIDKTDTITYTDDFMCGNFAKQTIINLNGFGEIIKDSSLIEEIDPADKYDFSNNGRFNLPVYQVHLRDPNHSINACLISENPLVWDDWYFIEPQDDKQIIIGDWNMADSSTVKIYHSYFVYEPYLERKLFLQEPFIEFQLTEGIPEFIKHDERLILQRPHVNSIKPEKLNLLEKFVLNQNYPNPFNHETSISYSIPVDSYVSIAVFTLQGRQVGTLVNGSRKAGDYTVTFDAAPLASGVYLYQFKTGNGFSCSRKMLLIK